MNFNATRHILLFFSALFSMVSYGSGLGNFSGNPETVSSRDSLMADFVYYQFPEDPLKIKFIDNSTGNIVAWKWDFDDGTTSSLQNPVHIFPEEGTYTVCLTVTDFFTGTTDTYCELIQVMNPSQFYSYFDFYKNPVNPMNIQFVDLSKGNISSWEWDFGDGESSYESNPEHIYTAPGTYWVFLSIKDQTGTFYDFYLDEVYINEFPPVLAKFDYEQNSTNPLEFQFSNTSVGGTIDFIFWDFGDGTISSSLNPLHVYENKGTYLVCIEVSFNSGQYYDWYCTKVNATGTIPCHADFKFELQPPDPLTVQFTGESLGDIDFWFWDFGDGTRSYEANPFHIYSEAGTYPTYLVIVNNASGCYDSIQKYVDVFIPPQCEALFDYEYLQSDSMTVQFTDLSLGIISGWFWDFGDGTTSTLQNPAHTFSEEGAYNVCLTVSSLWGPCQDTLCDTVTIDITPNCHAGFEFSPNPENPLEISFFDTSTGNIESWQWDFGDGSFSVEQNPTHTFSDTGEYHVCLTVFDNYGPCQDTWCDIINIEVPQLCNADFDFEQSEENPFEFSFTDLSTGIANAWDWNFGDGGFSNLQNPVHIFADTGAYEVCLTVYHTDSLLYCNSTFCTGLTVSVPQLDCDAAFVANVDIGVNKPNLYHFNDLSTGNPDLWLWDFGDGNASTEQNPDYQYADGGTYNVTLKITKLNPWGDDCEDTETIQITTPEYYDVGGMVFAGLFPINNPENTGDTAMIYLFRKINDNIIPLDTSFFTEYGYFYYFNMLSGDYLMKCILTTQSTNAPNYFPTYYGDELYWEDAQILKVADSNNYSANIILKEVPDASIGGTGKIEGVVIMSASCFPGDGPLEDAEIILYDNDNIPIRYTFSNQNGLFTFEDLAFGQYTLVAESTGLLTDPYSVILSEDNPVVENIELYLCENITGIEENENYEGFDFSYYPNPVEKTLNILIGSNNKQYLQFNIYNLLGQTVYQKKIGLNSNSKLITVGMQELHRGIYIAEMIAFPGKILTTFKIIKK